MTTSLNHPESDTIFNIYIIIHEGLKLFEYVITCYNLFTAGIILSTPMENKFSSAMISEG